MGKKTVGAADANGAVLRARDGLLFSRLGIRVVALAHRRRGGRPVGGSASVSSVFLACLRTSLHMHYPEYLAQLVSALVSHPKYRKPTIWACTSLLRSCWVPVSLAVAPIAAVSAFEGLHVFRLFGAGDRVAAFLGPTVLREYSPALCSVMVAAQAGSSIAARVGTMKLKGEIDALSVMSVDPVRYVIAPGVLACVVATPILGIWTNLLGLLAGWFMAVIPGGVNHGAFMEQLRATVTLLDLGVGVLKCFCFGAVIGVLAGYAGLNAPRSAGAVGQCANQTVLRAIVSILILDYVIGFFLRG